MPSGLLRLADNARFVEVFDEEIRDESEAISVVKAFFV